MCGIAGFYGEGDASLLKMMMGKILHRGPDHQNFEFLPENKIGLIHTRLSIIDLTDASNQPLWDLNRRYCVTFNGEIYNYKEIKKKLIGKGYVFSSNGDAEVLLNLYIDQGESCLGELQGIFAFAIWDSINKILFLARDQMGVKPFYYAAETFGFYFASEMKSLLCNKRIAREIDLDALALYIKYLWCPSPMTPLKKVKKLEPGHAMIVSHGQIKKKWKYYSLPNEADENDSYGVSERKLLNSLDRAVKSQIVSDVPLGAFLSGGLDSSALVAIASKYLGPNNVPCFTMQFDSGKSDGMHADLPYAKKVAKHLGVPLDIVNVTAKDMHELSGLIYSLDEPQADLAPINAMFISRLARQKGVKVLLSGAGGDDVLTGYRRHYAQSMERYWSWVPSCGRRALKNTTSRFSVKYPISRRIVKAFENADLDEIDRTLGYFNWVSNDAVVDLFKEAPNVGNDPMRKFYKSLPEDSSSLYRMLQIDTRYFLADHNFNYTDKVSMKEGVEVRVPLADTEFVKTAYSLPWRYKQKGKHGKWIFKKAMENYLPREVIYRPKTGFGLPVRKWIRGEMSSLVDELLSVNSISQRGIFSPLKVRELIEGDRAGVIDVSYSILALMSIELWFRQFVDPEIPTPYTL